MFPKAVCKWVWPLIFVPDPLKSKEMCTKAVLINSCLLEYAPEPLKIQGMCAWTVLMNPCLLKFVPDPLKF